MQTESRTIMNSSELNSSYNTSPNGTHLLVNDATNQDLLNHAPLRSTSMASPINLASNPNPNATSTAFINLSPPQQVYSLKLTNIPHDLTYRESSLIFSLATDLIDIELAEGFIVAKFKSQQTCITVGRLLDGKPLFGSSYPPVKAELDDFPSQLDPNAHNSIVQPFNSLNLNNNNISPPTTTSVLSQPPQSQSQSQGPTPSGSQQNIAAAAANFDSFGKRPSIGTQRSRFLFSDPFANPPPSSNGSISQPSGTSNGPVLTNSNSNGTDLDTGKSLLLMEAQNDAREYEQLVRDPWGPMGSTPQTPGANSVPFDWGSNDRRRTSSVFFPGQGTTTLQPPTLAPLTNPPQQSIQNSTSATTPQQQAVQQPNSSTQPNPSSQSASTAGSIPDLSLLARVPPPANPADQNPPCNTLYVGNLPPDATEGELRALFAPQKGFRRLSFRTKNQSSTNPNSNAHGPMCFVEFEDVAHATRALAELYGRALPRPGGSSGKGGIRLSFSKNPLGVRGPGNQRRTSAVTGFGYQTAPYPK